MTMYRPAREVAAIAKTLIEHVADHAPLGRARIEYVFREKAPKSGHRIILGKARRVGGLAAFLAEAKHLNDHVVPRPLFVVEISEDTWSKLNEAQQIALVDHELCHLVVEVNADGEVELSTRGHDFEEFAAIIRRPGLWSAGDAALGAAVAEQLSLAIEDVTSYVESLGNDEPPRDENGGES